METTIKSGAAQFLIDPRSAYELAPGAQRRNVSNFLDFTLWLNSEEKDLDVFALLLEGHADVAQKRLNALLDEYAESLADKSQDDIFSENYRPTQYTETGAQ